MGHKGLLLEVEDLLKNQSMWLNSFYVKILKCFQYSLRQIELHGHMGMIGLVWPICEESLLLAF